MVNTGGNFPLAGQEAFVKSLLNNYFLLSQFRNHHLSSKHIDVKLMRHCKTL